MPPAAAVVGKGKEWCGCVKACTNLRHLNHSSRWSRGLHLFQVIIVTPLGHLYNMHDSGMLNDNYRSNVHDGIVT
jgi:hypothetical protein